jgi:hypothetical protein
MSEIPADLTITVHLLKGIIVKSLANVFNIGVIWQFIAADYVNFGVEGVKVIFGAIVTGVAAIVEHLTVELNGCGEGFF